MDLISIQLTPHVKSSFSIDETDRTINWHCSNLCQFSSSIQQNGSRYRDLLPPSALIWIFNIFISRFMFDWWFDRSISPWYNLSSSFFSRWVLQPLLNGTHSAVVQVRILVCWSHSPVINEYHLTIWIIICVPSGYDVSSLIGKELTLTTDYVWVSKFEHCTLAWYRTIKAALTNDLLIWLVLVWSFVWLIVNQP